MRRRYWWESTTEEIYAYRTRKPGAVWGWPFLGRHWAYVGRTNDGVRRHSEHLIGGGKWAAKAKPWADLEPKRYVLARRKRRREITTHFLEWWWIHVLFPVYNVSMNAANPRRVKPWTQAEQRAARDAGRVRGVVAGAGRRWAVYTALMVAVAGSWWGAHTVGAV